MSKFQVGVSLLSVKQGMIGGLASYVHQLSKAMAEDAPSRYRFFVPERLEEYWVGQLPPGTRVIPCRNDNKSVVARATFEITRLPALALKAGCDVLFYPNTTAPLHSRPIPAVTVHDVMYRSQPNDMPFHKRRYLDLCYATLRWRRVGIITISEFSKQDIHRYTGIRLDRISTVYSGVDEQFFSPAAIESTRDVPALPEPYILSVAAAYPHKRLTLLVEAFEEIAKHRDDLSLVMAGTLHGRESERERLIRRIEASPMRDRIVRLGRLPWDALPVLYRSATALVHSSQFEGFGFPIAEAMASGVPVAAAPSGAVIEVLHGCGEIATGWSASDLAEAVRRVLTWTASEREAKLARAREIATQHYRWDRVADRMGEILYSLTRK